MAVSLNSVIRFNPTANYQPLTRTNSSVTPLKIPSPTSPLRTTVGLKPSTERKRSRFCTSASSGDDIATETTEKDYKPIERSYSNNGSSTNAPNAIDSSVSEEKVQPSDDNALAPQVSNTNGGKSSPALKKTPLTARERLRAARVISRYTETKPSKPQLGSKLLEALQETEKGKKRPSLPEAPTNLFDDSKRGLPKQGWTINLPGGMDVFFIVFSFVFISSVMFATTYIVWKVGAIHFNEY